MPRNTPATSLADFSIGSNSSPNILTAISSRTPAISSLKRIWIGWEKLKLVPASFCSSGSMRSISSAFVIDGSGHSSCGFRMT